MNNLKVTSEEELKRRLVEVLDEQFPKGECKERGHALVLFAEALLSSLEEKEVKEKGLCKNCGKKENSHPVRRNNGKEYLCEKYEEEISSEEEGK